MKTQTTWGRLLAVLMALLMCAVLVLSMSACDNAPADTDDPTDTSTVSTATAGTTPDEYAAVWANATYTEDTTLGEGAQTFDFKVTVGDNSVTFTVNTDESIVGTALLEHDIIAGDEGDFGLYVKTVNGMLADYDVDATYWSFYQNGEYAMTGVDQTEIEDGVQYEMVYTK